MLGKGYAEPGEISDSCRCVSIIIGQSIRSHLKALAASNGAESERWHGILLANPGRKVARTLDCAARKCRDATSCLCDEWGWRVSRACKIARTRGAFWDSPTPKAVGYFRTYPTSNPANYLHSTPSLRRRICILLGGDFGESPEDRGICTSVFS
jgi:hypothetical protein